MIPLALFAAAASRIPLSMLGLLQYLTPTTQFVIAVTVFGIWVALSGNTSIFRVVSYAWAGLGAAGVTVNP